MNNLLSHQLLKYNKRQDVQFCIKNSLHTAVLYALLSTQSEEIQNVLSPKPQEQNLFSESDKSPNFAYDLHRRRKIT